MIIDKNLDLISIIAMILGLIVIPFSTIGLKLYVIAGLTPFIGILIVVYNQHRKVKAQFSTWKKAWDEFNKSKIFGQNVKLVDREAVKLVNREAELVELRSMVNDPQIRTVVILGPPDIGKMRLIFEATEHLQNRTIKSIDPYSLSLTSLSLYSFTAKGITYTIKGFFARFFRQCRSKNEDISVVIEDLSRERAAEFIRRSLELNNLKILITMPTAEHVPTLNYGKDERIKEMQLAPLSEEQASELLNAAESKLNPDTKRWVVESASGNPGVLLLVAGLGLEKDGGDLADSITNEFKTRIRGVLSDDASKKLELLSVLTEVGIKNEAYQEIELICALFGDNIDPHSIVNELHHFESAGVVRYNGAYVEVQPHIFGDGLARSVMTDHSTQLSELFNKLNLEGKLRLISRIQDLKSRDVELFWDELFKPITSVQGLQSTLKSDHLLQLIASAVPERVMPLINERLKETTIEQLKEIAGAERRVLVFMLEELLYHEETSKEALGRLAMLAEAETEKYANNATEVFCNYFSSYHPYAPLSLDERLAELKAFVLSNEYSLELRSIGVKAIKRAIDHKPPLIFPSRRGMTFLGSLSDETYGEILDYIEGAANLLMDMAINEESSVAKRALTVLPQANVDCTIWTVRLISPGARFQPVVSRFKTLIDWTTAHKPISASDLKNALERVNRTLNEDVIKREKITIAELKRSPAGLGKSKSELKKLKEDLKQSAPELRVCLKQINQLTEKLTHADFSIRLGIWAGNEWSLEDYKEIRSGQDAVQAYKEPRDLAKEAIITPELLTSDLIQWLCSDETKRSHIFFRELGKLDSSCQFAEMIQQLGTEERSIINFAFYFEGLDKVNDRFVSRRLDELSDAGVVPSSAILKATGVIGYNKAGYQRLTKLIAKDDVASDLAVNALLSGDWIQRLSPDECYQLMEIVAGPNLENAASVLNYLNYWSYERPIEGQLAELAWSCLEVMPIIPERNYYVCSVFFDNVASVLASTDIKRGFELLKRTLKWSDETRSWENTFDANRKPWRPLSTQGPHDFWDILWKDDHERAIRFVLNLALEDPAIKYQITSGLRNVIDQDQDANLLVMLALENGLQARLICDSIRIDKPKYLDIARKIVECYPDNQSILGTLKGNFNQGGFKADIINVLDRYRKEIADLQTDVAVPESVQSWLNDLDAYLRNKIDSVNR